MRVRDTSSGQAGDTGIQLLESQDQLRVAHGGRTANLLQFTQDDLSYVSVIPARHSCSEAKATRPGVACSGPVHGQ